MPFVRHKWVVFIASIAVSFFNYGFPSSIGAMYIGLLDTFNAGRAKTALVLSLLFTFCWVSGIGSGFLISKFGITITTCIASLIPAIAFFACYFASSIYQLYGLISVANVPLLISKRIGDSLQRDINQGYISEIVKEVLLSSIFGLFSGMAFATMYICAVVCVGWTFTGRQKSMALAVQSVGTAISGFMWPNLLTASIETYSVRGTFLILSGIFLNNIPMAIIFSNCDASTTPRDVVGQTNEGYDISSSESTNNNKSSDISDTVQTINNTLSNANTTGKDCDSRKEKSSKDSSTIKIPVKIEVSDNITIKNEVEHQNIDIETPSVDKIETETETNTDFEGFKSVCCSKLGCLYGTYVVASVLNMTTLAGFLSVYQDINVYNGLTISQSDLTFMSYSLLNILSRFLPLVPARFPNINSFVVPVISSLCGGIGQLIILTNTSFTSTIIAMAFTAVADGGWVASSQVILFEILPHRFQAIGFGFVLTAMGIFAAPMGPIFGSVRDGTSSYQGVLVTTTTMLFTSALINLVCLFMSHKLKQNKYAVNGEVSKSEK